MYARIHDITPNRATVAALAEDKDSLDLDDATDEIVEVIEGEDIEVGERIWLGQVLR